MSTLQTEFEFFLPKGFVGDDGQVHRTGIMRLATARDELEPLRDPRVRDADDPFLTIIVLSRVVTRIGSITQITPREIESLFAADLAYLQDVYGAINFGSPDDVADVVDDAEQRMREAADLARAVNRRAATQGRASARPKRTRTVEVIVDDDDIDDDIDGELVDDEVDDDEVDGIDDVIDADDLAARLQARLGGDLDDDIDDDDIDDDIDGELVDDEPAHRRAASNKRRHIEEIGSRSG